MPVLGAPAGCHQDRGSRGFPGASGGHPVRRSLILLWGWSAWNGVRLLGRDGSLWPGLAAGLLFAVEFLLIFSGMTFTTASRGVIFLYTSPFIVALGAHLFLPNERMRMIQALGLLCAFAGVAVAFADALRLPTSRELIGDAMILLAAVAWGATTVLIKASRLASISPTRCCSTSLAFPP